MKKLLCGLLLSAILLADFAQAMAMSVGSPQPQPGGRIVNGWYEPGFQIIVNYGNGNPCTGDGNVNSVMYGPGENGSHVYAFYHDQFGNPYVVVDPQNYSSLSLPYQYIGTIHCSQSGIISPPIYVEVQQYTLQVDDQPPTVNINSPSSSPTDTTNSSYPVSGFAYSQYAGITSVVLYINGTRGPTATYSNGQWGANVPLNNGSNQIYAIATDNGDLSSQSNTVDIVRQTSGGGSGGGGTTGGGNGSNNNSGNSSGGTAASSSTSAGSNKNSSSSSAQATEGQVNLNPSELININESNIDKPSNPSVVLAESGFPKVVSSFYIAIGIVILILLILASYLVWRFRPVFSKLNKGNSGLRRKIILIVTLPSLLPMIGLGYLGYQQLSNSLKGALSQELARAAETSSIKLQREFAIRYTVISTNASNILQVQEQYQEQFNQLAQQYANCQNLMKSAIPYGHYASITSSGDCLPFLAALAQLTNPSASTLNSYQTALTSGYNNALANMQADENSRVNSYLAEVRNYFPEISELDVINTNKPAKVVATLPGSGSESPISKDDPGLLTAASASGSMVYDAKHKQLLLSYPVNIDQKLAGNVISSMNIDYADFIPAIWQATPKPYAQDKVYFINSLGQQIYPDSNGTSLTTAQADLLSQANGGSLVELKVGKNNLLATRVSQVTGTNWAVAVGAPPSSILAPISGIQRVALLAIAGFLLLSLVLGIFFVSKIATEIQRLFEGAVRFAKGELDYRIKSPSHDELGVLGETMNQMANDIKLAQAALVEKDKEFISIATHELKAPMTAIIGNLSMITEDHMGQVDPTAQKLIEQAYSGTVRLRALVSDMLDVARLESGKAEFKLEPLNISEVTRSIVEMQKVPAEQANVTINYLSERQLPMVVADKPKLEIIITNFISNAIKYNRPSGSVSIKHEIKDGSLVTSVADTGLGIPDDQKAHIFEKFYRVQHTDRANVPGTGLGMFITKRFVEAMSGQVWFTSIHGQGTTFYFSLPLAKDAAIAIEQ